MPTAETGTLKICPQCGTAFGCNPTDCWCSKLPPAMPMIENADCYCPQCLDAIIKEKMAGVE